MVIAPPPPPRRVAERVGYFLGIIVLSSLGLLGLAIIVAGCVRLILLLAHG
jgi:hypothetical protein